MGLGAIVAGVVTGEAVVLEVPCARFPSRLLALGIDLAIQLTVIVILLAIAGLGAADQVMDQAALQAIVLTAIVVTLVGYPVVWETTTRGRSPGKFALGLRVVSDDGGPERFRQALVRGLATIVDFWLLLGVPALISSLLSDKGKRLGDIFAGTFVIQHRLPTRRAAAPPPATPPELAAWATGLELSRLSDQTAAMARQYLSRLPELTPGARAELGERISAAVRAQAAPPPPPSARWTPPAAPPPPPAAPPPRPESRWAPPGRPPVPPTAWMGAAREGEGTQPGQPVEPGEPASPPAAGTGFVPPQ